MHKKTLQVLGKARWGLICIGTAHVKHVWSHDSERVLGHSCLLTDMLEASGDISSGPAQAFNECSGCTAEYIISNATEHIRWSAGYFSAFEQEVLG